MREAEPERQSQCYHQYEILKPEILPVLAKNPQCYGAKKVWKQLNRKGLIVARCTMARLMRALQSVELV